LTGKVFAGKWIELENIMLSEVSQAQNIKGSKFMFFLICGSEKEKIKKRVSDKQLQSTK
jgi:hypothetical protein